MDDLPPLLARWLADLVERPLPVERIATCGSCAMLPAGLTTWGATYFNRATKCCTYLPELHNFLVGRLLADDTTDPEGRSSVLRRLDAGIAVTPLGLGRPRSYVLVYDDGGESVFGRSASMRCPHYLDDGRCGVWRHRESTCATWFCKHERGKAGAATWSAARRVLAIAERALAWWCVQQVGVDLAPVERLLATPRRLARVSTADLDGVSAGQRTALWGSWAGRERDFYVECARCVEPLGWADVLAIGGPELGLAARVLTARLRGDERSTRPLRLGSLRITGVEDGQCRVVTYSPYDPLLLPLALVDALDAFDGRPTPDVLASLAADRGITLDDELLDRLVDFGVLVPEALGEDLG